VFWVHASTQARFEEAYRHIADRLELPGRDNPNIDVLRLVYNWLCDGTNGKWVMVLDNVDDVETFFSQKRAQDKPSGSPPASLAVYLPQSRNGSILITSRNKDAATRLAGGYNSIKEVRAMDESQGLQLLRNKLQDTSTEDGAVDLLRALDYIPLAITQAAAYINRRARMTVSGYLDEFCRNDKKKENLLNRDAGDLRRDDSALNSVVTTWQISFERIREERPSAADLLSLMSFFNPQGIPESILRRHSRNVAKPDDEDEAESAFDEDFDTLLAYSLIVVTANTHVCEMHALVQFCTRVWLSSIGDTERWRRKFLALMAGEFPLGMFENWVKCQQLIPHLECLFHQEPTEEESLRKWAQVLTNAARYMWTKGKYSAARDAAMKAVTTREQILGHDDHFTLTSVEILGLVLQYQGKYDEAEKMNRRALEGYEKALGKEHQDTLVSMANLAEVLRHQGKYEEAEKTSQRAFEGSEKVLGKEHRTTLTSLNNLALALEAQGKYKEAENMYRRALEGHENALGKEHPNTLILASNLALVLKDQAKYEEAENINRQALGRRDKVLGKEHPDTLASVAILADVLNDQGKYDEAEKMSLQALEGKEKVLGKEHPNTLVSVNTLAVVLHNLGNHDEAEKMNRRALNGREKVLGKEHPQTLESVNNLASVLYDQGNYSEAEKMYRRALDGVEKVLGKEHPLTLTSMNNLASVLHGRGDYGEVEKMYRRVLDGEEKVLGKEHPGTLTSMNNLASVLKDQGNYGEAEKMYRRALDGMVKVLGKEHPSTLTVRNNLTSVLQYVSGK
jgi:tetratricopeptide (TPR) repeat protein